MRNRFFSFLSCSTGLLWGCVISPSSALAQSQSQTPVPSNRQILEACQQNQVETLPNPFVDVAPTHWAYRAVLSIHYCGPFRQATPSTLIERLSNGESSSKPSNSDMVTSTPIKQ